MACTEFFIVTEYCELNLFNSMDPEKLPNPQPVDFTEYSYYVRHLINIIHCINVYTRHRGVLY